MDQFNLLTAYGPLGVFAALMVGALVYIVRDFRQHMQNSIKECKEDRARLIATLEQKEEKTQELIEQQVRREERSSGLHARTVEVMDRCAVILEKFRADDETHLIYRENEPRIKRPRSDEFYPHEDRRQ